MPVDWGAINAEIMENYLSSKGAWKGLESAVVRPRRIDVQTILI